MYVYTLYVNVHKMIMSSDSVHIDNLHPVLIPSAVATAIIFTFVLIVISLLCIKKSGIR